MFIFLYRNTSLLLMLTWLGLTSFIGWLLWPMMNLLVSGFGVQSLDTWHHLMDSVLWEFATNTLGLVLIVGVGVAVIGSMTAWTVSRYDFWGRRWFEWALLLPLAMPAYVSAYAYTDFLQFTGPLQTLIRQITGWSKDDYHFPEIRSLLGASWVMMLVLYPYVYGLMRGYFLTESHQRMEACQTLGLSPSQALWRVILPLSRPTLVAGCALVMMETLADFGTVHYFALPTLTTGIYRAWIHLGDTLAATQLALLMLFFVALVLTLERWYRRMAQFTTDTKSSHSRQLLTGKDAWIAWWLCFIPILFGFLVPAALLMRLAWQETVPFPMESGLLWMKNTFFLASMTAITIVLMGFLMVAVHRLMTPSWFKQFLNRGLALLGFGYAIPGLVIAIAVLLTLTQLQSVWNALQQATGWSWLMMTWVGSSLGLFYAYFIRFSAIAIQSLVATSQAQNPYLEDAAQCLGYSHPRIVIQLHFPLFYKSMLSTGLLVFIDVMKELPATMLLRPFDFDTLATKTFAFASDERLGEAGWLSLSMVLIGLLPIILLTRSMESTKIKN